MRKRIYFGVIVLALLYLALGGLLYRLVEAGREAVAGLFEPSSAT